MGLRSIVTRARLIAIITATLTWSTVGTAAPQVSDGESPEAPTAKVIAAGYDIYQAAGSCRSCHGELGRGGVGGPSLRDGEWLHIDPEMEQIAKLIARGVAEEEIKARRRPWAMDPNGGADLTPQDLEAVTAFVWALSHHVFEPSVEDEFVELLFDRSIEEARRGFAAYRDAHDGLSPVSAQRFRQAASHAYNVRPRRKGVQIAQLGVELFPSAADLRYTQSSLLNGLVMNGGGDDADLAAAIAAAEAAIAMAPDHRNRRKTEENLAALREH